MKDQRRVSPLVLRQATRWRFHLVKILFKSHHKSHSSSYILTRDLHHQSLCKLFCLVNPTPSVSTHSPLRNPFSRHHHLPRRRSLDDPAAMVNPQSRSSSPTRKHELPYPRGGRQIGADPPQPLSRSNSAERKAHDNAGSFGG
jgi:hypothetical protein